MFSFIGCFRVVHLNCSRLEMEAYPSPITAELQVNP